jgi:transposase-like protein
MADVRCPFCTAPLPDLVSLFGSQLLLSQYRCSACGSYFEGVREDRADSAPSVPASEGGNNDDASRAEQ